MMHLWHAAAPGDDGEVGRRHAGAHEQNDVLMAGLPVVHHLLFKELQVILVVAVDLQQTNGDLAVPAAFVHLPPTTLNSHNVRRVRRGSLSAFTQRFRSPSPPCR